MNEGHEKWCTHSVFPGPESACTCALQPVRIDIERMERALAGPRWTVPSGLSREEIIQFMNDCADGKIPPDA